MINKLLSNIMIAAPGFNLGEFKKMVESFSKPLTTAALWAVPIVGGLMIIIHGIEWLQKQEQEKDQKPFKPTFVKMIKWIIIIELVPAILKIFGL